MKKRNLLALVLALALTLGLAAPAGAAAAGNPVTGGETSVEIIAKMNLPTIEVTIGNAPTLIVNPYGLNYDVTNRSEFNAGGTLKDTIITAPVLISSSSAIDLTVEATPTGTSTGTNPAGFSATAIANPASENSKLVYMFLELASVDGTDPDNLTNTETYGASWKAVTADLSGATTCAVVTGNGANTAKFELTKGTGTGVASYCAYKLTGHCSGPKANWVSGDSGDKITVNIAFTFKPVIPTT